MTKLDNEMSVADIKEEIRNYRIRLRKEWAAIRSNKQPAKQSYQRRYRKDN